MRHNLLLLLAITLGAAILPLSSIGDSSALAAAHTHKLCTAVPGTIRCLAAVVSNGDGTPHYTSAPQGYGPDVFRTVYGTRNGGAAHIGIVAAYDAPHIQTDLATFSKTYHLPVMPACAKASQTGCFEKVNQHGSTSYPKADSGWATEISLDVETAHGQCPGCRISLVEANSPSIDNLSASVDEAVSLGAKVISNSYGGSESSGEAGYDSHYHKPGVTMVASSGDSGYGTSYPAASPYVIAVGGTTLKLSGSRVSSETVWDGAGSGCSQFEYKPSWQHDKKCSMRSIADVAADADPNTGAAIYDSYASNGHNGWLQVGGTSLAAPLVAGILGASGKTNIQPNNLYDQAANIIRDIIAGSNGSCATYLCKATPGYDGPTGLGVLNSL
jgi:subtilase family serine protease